MSNENKKSAYSSSEAEILKRVRREIPTFVPCEGQNSIDELLGLLRVAHFQRDSEIKRREKDEKRIQSLESALKKAKEALEMVHRNWPDCFHDAISTCTVCKALAAIDAIEGEK